MDTAEKTRRGQSRKPASPAAGGKSAGRKQGAASSGRATAASRAAKNARPSGKSAASGRSRRREPAPEVVYAPARPFSRNRFLLRLVTVAAVVLALTFAVSIFFKVKVVTVSGAVKYDAWTVREASGIEEGEGLLTFGEAAAGAKIKTALPYVESVRIGIKLPDTVNIEIVESDVAYAVAASDGTWWLMTAEGKILEQIASADAAGTTVIKGVELETPVGEKAQAYTQGGQNAFGETVPALVDAREQLNVLETLLQNLEMNGVIGDADVVDVSDLDDLQLWYGERYQVKFGDSSRLEYKIQSMRKVFEQEAALEPGVIDVSYSDRPNEVVFTPFA